MSLAYKFSGKLVRNATALHHFKKHLKLAHLKPAKKLTFSFNPFEENVQSIRDIHWYLSSDEVRITNPRCAFKVNILTSDEEPSLEVQLENNKTVLIKSKNLNSIEIIKGFNKYVSSLHVIEKPPKKEKLKKKPLIRY